MKHKLIICTLVVAFSFSKTTIAQSSVTGNNGVTNNTVIVDGIKFPMTASEYNVAKQKLAQQKQNTQTPVSKQEVPAALKVTPVSNEELKNLNKTNNPSVSPASKPVTTTERSN